MAWNYLEYIQRAKRGEKNLYLHITPLLGVGGVGKQNCWQPKSFIGFVSLKWLQDS